MYQCLVRLDSDYSVVRVVLMESSKVTDGMCLLCSETVKDGKCFLCPETVKDDTLNQMKIRLGCNVVHEV